MDQHHIIKKQILDVDLDTDVGSFVFKSELSDLYYSEIVPLLEQYCSEISDTSEILRIDRLEVDLGSIDPSNLVNEFRSKIIERFPGELKKKLETVPSKVEQTVIENLLSDSGAYVANDNEDISTSHRSEATQSRLETLTYFLETGTLPWWIGKEVKVDVVAEMEAQIQQPSDSFKQLIYKISNNPGLSKRLTYYFSDNILESVISLFKDQHIDLIINTRAELTEALSRFASLKNISEQRIRNEIWQCVLSSLSNNRKGLRDRNSITRTVVEWLADVFQLSRDSVVDFIATRIQIETDYYIKDLAFNQKKAITNFFTLTSDLVRNSDFITSNPKSIVKLINEISTVLYQVIESIDKSDQWSVGVLKDNIQKKDLSKHFKTLKEQLLLLSKELRKMYDQDRVIENTSLVGDVSSVLEVIKQINEDYSDDETVTETPELSTAVKKHNELFAESEEFYVNNSGIVLFWPYLEKFFESVGLLENRQFKDQESQEKAILLLQFIVNGETTFDEYDLVLNKILCGLDPNTPIPVAMSFADHELSEAVDLISALIQHWSILKNTSPDTLRQMFLIRDGMIMKRDGNWVLRVEDQSLDVLLDKMPWQFTTIKLPWMENLIFVEWRL